MEIKTTQLKRCTLVEVSGRIDSATAPQLQAALKELNETSQFKLVLDLKNVDFISSAGLWVLVNAQKNCKRFNRGELVLASVSQRVHSALDLAGFVPYYRIFPDSAQAVGAF